MKYVFVPGCALVLYEQTLAEKIHSYLGDIYEVHLSQTCCRHTPQAVMGKCVINVCPGCDRRYRQNYAEPSTISLWELLADSSDFPFPDYAANPCLTAARNPGI